MIRAIETEYGGVRFRSRLEARWAVFFDALQIPWLYEPEGYELDNGTRYLPDFRLGPLWPDLTTKPEFLYVEVKPAGKRAWDMRVDFGPFAKALSFAKESHYEVVLVEGEPSTDCIILAYMQQSGDPDIKLYREEFHWRAWGAAVQPALDAARAYRFWDPPEARR